MNKAALITIVLLFSISLFGQSAKGTITGKVVDAASNEPLPGVNIVVVGTNIGAASNIKGEFVLQGVSPGVYQVRASYVGYGTVTKSDVSVNTGRPTNILISLSESALQLQSVTVKSSYFNTSTTEFNSLATFGYEEIRRSPGGFEDVVRALSVLPGVAQASPGRNDLVVRGGAPSENLYIVDGFVVPNINHFGNQGATGGPLSFINLDFVRETAFSTGGFSAKYGDKLSSTLSIDLREGRQDRIGGKATISATQFAFNLEGPATSKSTFIVSVRRSYLDFIFDAAGFNFVPEYWDAMGKYVYEFDSQNKITGLFIGALDRVKFNSKTAEDRYDNSRILGSDQNQYVGGITYRHLFNRGFFDITASRNFIDYNSSQKDTLQNPIFLNQSQEAENEIKAEGIYKIYASTELNFGASAKLINFNSKIQQPYFKTTFGEVLSITGLSAQKNFTKYSAFLQYASTAAERYHYNLGVRGDYFTQIENKFTFSPRFGFNYMVDPLTHLSFSTGVYYQSPSYIWLVADRSNLNLRSVRVNQYVFGYDRMLREDTQVKVEVFYKKYTNYPASVLRPYVVLANTGAGFSGSSDNYTSFGLEPLVSEGNGTARGVEFSLRKKSSELPYYGIISVTGSRATYIALDGVPRPGAYDQSLIINISGGYIFNKEWEASFKFRLSTGNPYTPYNDDGTQDVSMYNVRRFKSLHALDLRVDKRWNFENMALITYLDVQNVYNNKNSNTVSYNSFKKKVEYGASIGILPSIGVSLEF
jgi:hypothetical protein